MATYTVKNVKTFEGMEGGGFEVTLYKDGKRIGKACDDATGGEINLFLDDGEEDLLHAHCAALPKIPWDYPELDAKEPEGMQPDVGTFIEDLVVKYTTQQWLKRNCKTKTMFRIKGDKKDAWRTIKGKFTPQIKAWIVKKYGDTIERIANEEFKQ
jgi:hypothetical protein